LLCNFNKLPKHVIEYLRVFFVVAELVLPVFRILQSVLGVTIAIQGSQHFSLLQGGEGFIECPLINFSFDYLERRIRVVVVEGFHDSLPDVFREVYKPLEAWLLFLLNLFRFC